MTKFFYLLLLSPFVLAQTNNNVGEFRLPICEDIASADAPFFVSDTYAQGAFDYENFRHLEDPDNNDLNRYIPRGSIVYSPPELLDIDDEERRVPVKVLNVRTEIDELSKGAETDNGGTWFQNLFGDYATDEARRVDVGEVGYIDNRSLKPAGDFVFYIEKDAPVYNSPSGVPLNGKRIRPRMSDEENYLVRKCCFDKPGTNPTEICFQFHLYDILDENNNIVGGPEILRGLGCGFLGDLEAIPTAIDPGVNGINNILLENEDAFEVLGDEFGVEDLELLMVDATVGGNSLREPTVRIPVNETTNLGPFNTRVYTPETENIDGRLHPMTTCAFMRVAQAWEQVCNEPGCEIQFGNAYVHDDWGPHSSHDSARCIDIRPFRLDDDDDAGNHILWNGPDAPEEQRRYDQDRTLDFMNLLVEAGAQNMIFGDSTVVTSVNETRTSILETDPESYNPSQVILDSGQFTSSGNSIHHNHIHFCLDPERDLVKDACEGDLIAPEEVPVIGR